MTVSQYYVLRKRQLRGIRPSIETEGVSVLDEYYWLNMKLFFTPDEELFDKPITDYFDDEVLESNFWLYWRTMFAFENQPRR